MTIPPQDLLLLRRAIEGAQRAQLEVGRARAELAAAASTLALVEQDVRERFELGAKDAINLNTGEVVASNGAEPPTQEIQP